MLVPPDCDGNIAGCHGIPSGLLCEGDLDLGTGCLFCFSDCIFLVPAPGSLPVCGLTCQTWGLVLTLNIIF